MSGAIFDVDGTILDSMMIWYEVTKRFFKLHGHIPTDEKIISYKDMTLNESLPMINKELELNMTNEEIFEEFRKIAEYEYVNTIPLKQGIDKYLKKLHDSGVKIAVATSGYEGMCRSAFERLGIISYIDAYAFSSEVGVNKSQPDIYILAAERIGKNPSECVVYEDIVPGIASAGKAGFKTCAVYDETNKDETEMLKNLADRYIVSWNELL